jgi:hypothetical protein
MASRAHRGPHMDEGVAILQGLMATEEMLITALWQYEDAMLFDLVRSAIPGSAEQLRAKIAPKGIHRNGISRLDRRWHGAGRCGSGARAGCRAVLCGSRDAQSQGDVSGC